MSANTLMSPDTATESFVRSPRRLAWIAAAAVFACSLVAVAPAQAQGSKIGFVNTERILRDSAPAKAAQTKIESEFKKRDDELQRLGTNLRNAAQKFEKDAPVLSESDRNKRQRELANMDIPSRFTELSGLTDPGWGGNCHLSRVAMTGIDALVTKMRAVGTEVVLMLAPYPSKTLENAVRLGFDLSYLDEMRRELAAKYPHSFYDFTDIRPLGAGDCEFLDSSHGGEVAFMRMFDAAAKAPLSPLHRVVDRAYLERTIAANAGRIMVADNMIGRKHPALMALAEKLRCSR